MPMSRSAFAPPPAFRRWIPDSFESTAAGTAKAAKAQPEAQPVALPTAQELEAIHDQAQQEGYQAGYTEGLARGQQETRTLLALADAFRGELARLDEAVAGEVATLALAVAQRVIGVAYAADPGLVATMVEQALQALPPNLEPVRVLVHPDDVAVVTQHIGSEFSGRRISIAADRQVGRGGCRLATATTDIDSSLETRWARITGALGGLPWVPLERLEARLAATTEGQAPPAPTADDDQEAP